MTKTHETGAIECHVSRFLDCSHQKRLFLMPEVMRINWLLLPESHCWRNPIWKGCKLKRAHLTIGAVETIVPIILRHSKALRCEEVRARVTLSCMTRIVSTGKEMVFSTVWN